MLGRYLVVEEHRADAVTGTLRAYDPLLQREVLLVLLRTAALSPERRQDALREAREFAKLNHPSLVAVYDVEVLRDDIEIAMEYVRGAALESSIQDARRAKRTRQAILRAFVDAGEGLSAAHAAGLVHGDVRLANVLRGGDGRGRLAGLGFATLRKNHAHLERPVRIEDGSLVDQWPTASPCSKRSAYRMLARRMRHVCAARFRVGPSPRSSAGSWTSLIGAGRTWLPWPRSCGGRASLGAPRGFCWGWRRPSVRRASQGPRGMDSRRSGAPGRRRRSGRFGTRNA